MARIETDPNYANPTFSRADAATDLFKKEDVQKLAHALSTHTHAPGYGLPLAAGAIPDSSITSGKILDGTITTADIAPNAAWAMLNQYVATPTFSTTTTGSPVATPVTTTFTATTGTLLISVHSPFNHNVVGGTWFLGLQFDGTAATNIALGIAPIAGLTVALTFNYYIALAAGAHTVVLTAYNATPGTLTATGATEHRLYVSEHRR